jgi:hypothetical protein
MTIASSGTPLAQAAEHAARQIDVEDARAALDGRSVSSGTIVMQRGGHAISHIPQATQRRTRPPRHEHGMPRNAGVQHAARGTGRCDMGLPMRKPQRFEKK